MSFDSDTQVFVCFLSTDVQPLDLSKLHDDQPDKELETTESSTWRHHITIPQPFKMCEREQQRKQTGTQPRSRQNLRAEDANKEKELTEIQQRANQFRAKPIPAHVYLPLFEELMERQAERREAVRAHSKEVLKATEKPFRFTIRERRKKERGEMVDEAEVRRRSISLMRQSVSAGRRKSSKDMFRDTFGLPDHLYENRMERLHEDQLLREVKRQLRAQRLLQSASLPAGMEERERRAAKRRADREARKKQLGLDPESDLQQRTARQFRARPAPDFKQLHWQADKSLRRLWRPPPEPTRPKPFNLHTSKRSKSASAPSTRSRSAASATDDLSLDGNKSMSPKNITPGPHNYRRFLAEMPSPAKANASMLRENYVRQSMERARLEAKKAEEMELAKRLKQSELSRLMRGSACYFGDQAVSPKQLITAVTENRKKELV
ncbi:unnamed protein product [Echinostoma caproni]|uniref:Protein FAM161B n=1 Tax=Echinostoma caproni TaxID=27848 RepID=A0A183AGI5_9TREM|nr:unnamed protein product [Echinostoma caproni]